MGRILVVDDVEANRLILKSIIQDTEHIAVLAENGVQALMLLERIAPTLIITDIAMPQMDGYEFCQTVKRNVQTQDIPVIFISAMDNPEDVVKGFQVGGADYITKPFIKEVVKARIQLHVKTFENGKYIKKMNQQLQLSVNEWAVKVEEERKRVLYALGRVARANAMYDVHYMDRISENCRTLAEAMQLSPEYESIISGSYIEVIRLASALCDLGNVAIPSYILQKEGALTAEEQELVHTHTTVGAQILQDITADPNSDNFLRMAINIAQHHHENWDGSGYPNGVQGMDIPLSAQIVAIVSNYTALTEKRSYREAYSQAEALEIMEQEAGKFNPVIFGILKKIVRQFV